MKFLIYKSKFTFEPTNIKNIKMKKMKKILFLLATVLFLACNNTKAQNTTIEGAFTSYGTNATLAATTADTVFFKGQIPSTGNAAIMLYLSSGATTASISGLGTLWVSMDGVNYTRYHGVGADSSGFTLSAVSTVQAPPTSNATVANGVFHYAKVWFPNYLLPVTTSGTIGVSGNPYKYYMVRFISTAATSASITASVRYICRRTSAY